jgi:hypothetical protein
MWSARRRPGCVDFHICPGPQSVPRRIGDAKEVRACTAALHSMPIAAAGRFVRCSLRRANESDGRARGGRRWWMGVIESRDDAAGTAGGGVVEARAVLLVRFVRFEGRAVDAGRKSRCRYALG